MRVSGTRLGTIEAPNYTLWYYKQADAFIESNGRGIGGCNMRAGDEAGAVWPGLEPRSERIVYCFDQHSCDPSILVCRSDTEGEQLQTGRGGGDGAELIIAWGRDVQSCRDEAYELAIVGCDETQALRDDKELEEEMRRVVNGKECGLYASYSGYDIQRWKGMRTWRSLSAGRSCARSGRIMTAQRPQGSNTW